MVVDDQRHVLAALSPGWNVGIHCQGDWMRLRTGLDGFGSDKIFCPFPGIRNPHHSSVYGLFCPGLSNGKPFYDFAE